MRKIIIVCLIFLFSSCYTYKIQTGIQPEKYETKRSLFPHKNLVLTADSVKVKGFYPELGCFTFKDIKRLKKTIPRKYKKYTAEISYFSNDNCLGLFELSYRIDNVGFEENITIQFIMMRNNIIANFDNRKIDKNDLEELYEIFEVKYIDEIVEYFNKGMSVEIVLKDCRGHFHYND